MSYRQIRDPDLLHRLIEAILVIGQDGDLTDVLSEIVEQAVTLTNARYGALGIVDEDRVGLREFITAGLSPEERAAIGHFPAGEGILKHVIDNPVPLRIDDLSSHPLRSGFPEHHPAMSAFLGVPVRLGDGKVFGNLYLCEKRDGTPFSEVDEELVDALGRAAGILIDKMQLRSALRDLTVAQDRERIARDLHDDVIQRLFAVGLTLQSLSNSTTSITDAARLGQAVSDLDDTIREIRSTIFAMNISSDAKSLNRQLLELCHELGAQADLAVSIEFIGSLEEHVNATVAAHLQSALREALSNVARHAHASNVTVEVESSRERVVLRVSDDGTGIPTHLTGTGLGLKNLSKRAASCGGWSELSASPLGGAVFTWCALSSNQELSA